MNRIWLGSRIRIARERKRFTQNHLSEIVVISPTSLSSDMIYQIQKQARGGTKNAFFATAFVYLLLSPKRVFWQASLYFICEWST